MAWDVWTNSSRLNEVSSGLTFRIEDGWLLAEPREGGTLNEVDRQIQAFIADAADIPMRMTNRNALLGSPAIGYHWKVELDAWQSGYVDIDDFLASSPSNFMTTPRASIAREATDAQLRAANRLAVARCKSARTGRGVRARAPGGLDAELAILRDYVQDPSVTMRRPTHMGRMHPTPTFISSHSLQIATG